MYQGRRFGHVVFRYNGALASLLVTEGVPPAAAELEPLDGWTRSRLTAGGRFVGFVVADLDRSQVLRLAQALADPLSRHLA